MSLLLLLKDKPKANVHTDAFDNSIQPQSETPPWFTHPASATTEVEDTVNLTCTLVASSTGYSTWKSIDTWDLKDSQVHMEIVHSLGANWQNTDAASAEAGFYFRLDNNSGNEQAQIKLTGSVANGLECFWNRREDGIGNSGQETYNATNHRWLRIREASGTIYFERSSDGVSWTVMNGGGSGEAHTWTDAELGTCSFTFFVGNGNVPSPGSIVFDNLNIAGVAGGSIAFRRIVNVT